MLHLSQSVRERLRRWGDSHRAVAVYLHGSVVRGKARPDSDQDVAVLLEARGTWLAEDRLVEDLRSILTEPAGGRELDIKVLNEAPQAFQYRVVRDRGPVWEGDPEARIRFERNLMLEYLDYRYYEDQLRDAMTRRITRASLVVDRRFLHRLLAMIRFRNLIVHRYWEVSPERVWSILEDNLGDLSAFCLEVARFLEANPDV